MPNRRDFFRSFSMLPAIAAVPPAQKVVPEVSRIERLINTCSTPEFHDFEGRRILWTGWKTNTCSLDLSSQWVVNVDPPIRDREVFVIPFPGYWGYLLRGDGVNVDYRPSQLYTVDLIHEQHEERLHQVQRVTAELLLEFLRLEGTPGMTVVRPNEPWFPIKFTWPWEKLRSWRMRFYVDPYRWVRDEAGLNPESEQGIGLMRQAHQRLYGLKER